jgi:hypothetical protein
VPWHSQLLTTARFCSIQNALADKHIQIIIIQNAPRHETGVDVDVDIVAASGHDCADKKVACKLRIFIGGTNMKLKY